MEHCNRSRILVLAAIGTLSVATVTLLGVVISREVRANKANSFGEESIKKAYPSFFRSAKDHDGYLRYFHAGLKNRTVVVETANTSLPNGTFCQFCFQTAQDELMLATEDVYHACCVSNVEFTSPDLRIDVFGILRTLVQFQTIRQYFPKQNCRILNNCNVCACSLEQTVFTAVVVKLDVIEPKSLSDVETDLFYFDGCCKCIN